MLLRNYLFAAFFIITCTEKAASAAEPTYLAQWLQQPSLQFGDTTMPTTALHDFYASQDYQPVWIDANGLTPRATQALAVIATADTDGLNPELYAINTIRAVAAMPRSDAEMAMRINTSLELLTSAAVLRYASDMQGGATPHQWNTGKPALAPDRQLELLKQASATGEPAAFLTSLAPAFPQYKALKTALQQYQTIAAQGGWPVFTPGKVIKSGMSDPRLATVQQILVSNHDLPAGTPAQTLYTGALVEGIKHFQQRHGLEPDGVVTTATQTALAVPAQQRVNEIVLSLERMRWMPHDLGPRYVLVNLPGYRLTAVSPEKSLSMNVIVGKPSTPTPMFSKTITNVIFNPSWGVPAKIALNEMLPKIRNNPDFFAKAGYTVVEHDGGESHIVDPDSVDWNSVSRGSMNYSFRQNPGDDNALGKVKFSIPDSDDIYLHDTSNRKLFVHAERDLSHGCVRLGSPKALTEFAMAGEGWSMDKTDATYDNKASRTVRIAALPVYLVYWTSWVDEQGSTHFSHDIYNLDKPLLSAMSSPRKPEAGIKLAAD
jgi:murein L,D-transpeptidase YcbB/YkuD